MKRFILNQRGSLLLMSVLILTGVLSIVFTVSTLIMSGIILSNSQLQSIQAYFAADAGIEEALMWARKSSTPKNILDHDFPDVVKNSLSNKSFYSVDYITWPNQNNWQYIRNLTSKGVFGGMRRTIEAQYGFIQSENILGCNKERIDLCDTKDLCESVIGVWVDARSKCLTELNEENCKNIGGVWDLESLTCN